jgi:hypothetical protein
MTELGENGHDGGVCMNGMRPPNIALEPTARPCRCAPRLNANVRPADRKAEQSSLHQRAGRQSWARALRSRSGEISVRLSSLRAHRSSSRITSCRLNKSSGCRRQDEETGTHSRWWTGPGNDLRARHGSPGCRHGDRLALWCRRRGRTARCDQTPFKLMLYPKVLVPY